MENETIKNIDSVRTKLHEADSSIKYMSLVASLLTITTGMLIPVIGIPVAIAGLAWTTSFLINKMQNEELSKTIKTVLKRIDHDKELQEKVDEILKKSDTKNLNKNLSELLVENSTE